MGAADLDQPPHRPARARSRQLSVVAGPQNFAAGLVGQPLDARQVLGGDHGRLVHHDELARRQPLLAVSDSPQPPLDVHRAVQPLAVQHASGIL